MKAKLKNMRGLEALGIRPDRGLIMGSAIQVRLLLECLARTS